ncbi:hypothetical protein HZA75_05360 [Candidatus Roizmanbacteria bacterium]|nr:hypothetical protein [Candidatus Roizmanbacteria bacterium]
MRNKFKKILLLNLKETLNPSYLSRLNKIAETISFLPKDSSDIYTELKEADCLLVNQGMTVDKKIIDSAPNLKYVGICATGYGRVDTKYANSKGIAICNVPGYATESVAEFVFAMLLEYLREIERAKKQIAKSIYSEVTFTGTQIKDKVFGVIGLGRIGQRVAEIASQGFKAKTIYWSRNKKEQAEQSSIFHKSLEKLLKESDIISFHLSLNSKTEKIINKKLINSIKPGAIVINTAPMELFDLKALETRLKRRDMTFILDHSDEMTPEDIKKLKKYKNCIIYPPIGFTTKEATALKKEIFVSNIENFLKGILVNKVN